MTTYQHTPDGDGEDCLWFRRDSYPHWQPLLRRVDLPPDARGLWADVVAGVLSRSDGQARGVMAIRDHVTFLQSKCEHSDWRGDFGDLRAPLGFDRCQQCGLLRCAYCEGKGCPDCKTVVKL